MSFKFEFIPHNINNMYQGFRRNNSFSNHLLINTNNEKLWNLFKSIDSYSLCVNRNSAIDKVIYIIKILKQCVTIYTNIQEDAYKEISNYDIFLEYLKERLRNGKKN